MDIGYIVLEAPAWFLGHVIGGVLVTGILCGTVAIAYYAGASVYRLVRIPYLRVALAIVVGVYVSAVLYRSITWTGVALVRYIDRDED
ncbi:hypothetical protein ACO34A_13160 [Rhizobium sp. ACO-34A]|nr:hypothetical protein [Rhizobium sp. ACO-34A]ATN34749.1 hypothetical protein ACO34A_13160 [Rhizobium sp. ACO-34A]